MRPLVYALFCSMLFTPMAEAKDHGKPNRPPRGERRPQVTAVDRRDRTPEHYRFSPREVRVIRDYYAPRYRALPPGLQKKFYRTGQLPPGWQKKLRPLPVVVERRLVRVPRGYRRGVLDNYVVVVDPRRQLIVDVTPVYVR